MNDPKSKALERMISDMDGMEGQKMFGGDTAKSAKGVDITISVVPNGESDGDEEMYPEGHDEALCKGGCAYHKGGMVTPEEDESVLPPFLRKKKKPL